MAIEVRMPALSPTMEKGALAKWLVAVGDHVKAGDLLAEIETDKATIEFESADDGRVAALSVAEGTEDILVGSVIATLAEEDDDALDRVEAPTAAAPPVVPLPAPSTRTPESANVPNASEPDADTAPSPRVLPGDLIKATPLAARIASARGIDLEGISGTGPDGRIVKADLEPKLVPASVPVSSLMAAPASRAEADARAPIPDIPHTVAKLSNMRKTIARRLVQSKREAPHIYLTVDIKLDALLELRGALNATLESRGIKLSVNDMLIKAQAVALMQTPSCNVMFSGEELVSFQRADIAVAVSIPNGLITPVIVAADRKTLSVIAAEMKDFASRAKAGKLKPEEYSGGTASLSNMGMLGIKQFDAVINPPQGMILAIGAAEKRACVGDDGGFAAQTVMSATGSFDHRAIDGADGAAFMTAFKSLVETPIRLIA